jgi:hypothetical protein
VSTACLIAGSVLTYVVAYFSMADSNASKMFIMLVPSQKRLHKGENACQGQTLVACFNIEG